jgi:hypothetical protein
MRNPFQVPSWAVYSDVVSPDGMQDTGRWSARGTPSGKIFSVVSCCRGVCCVVGPGGFSSGLLRESADLTGDKFLVSLKGCPGEFPLFGLLDGGCPFLENSTAC